jgi:Ser/Thr protein kinase RdoA (MazF antagonist)
MVPQRSSADGRPEKGAPAGDRPERDLSDETLRQVASRFGLPGPVESVEPLGAGLINDTFVVVAGDARYVLQRINDRVFPYPERIMDNLLVLMQQLARLPLGDTQIPRLVPAADGSACLRGVNAGIWRMTTFVPGARVLPAVDHAGQAREVGRLLGHFHWVLRDLDPTALAVTLPGLHSTPSYLKRFHRALATAESAGRSPEVSHLADFIIAREGGAGVLAEAQEGGSLRLRVTHGDPKLDNFLFDEGGRRAISLVDLDTVQPGLIQHDIADCLRSCCNRRGEATAAGTEVRFDLGLCRNLLAAFSAQTRGLLDLSEVAPLYEAVRLVPFELGLRFLTDHLEGDRYFRVREPGENLRKAQVQFALVRDIEQKEQRIRDIIRDAFAKGRQ